MTTQHSFDELQWAQQSGRTTARKLSKSEYPSEEPFEEHVAHTKSHSMACATLERSIEDAVAGISVGGDQFIYYVEDDTSSCLAPDVFVKLEKEVKNFDSWFTWEDGTPELAVEIVSAWDRMKLTWEEKLERYVASGIREVVRFDPKLEQSIRIWDRVGQTLVERRLGRSPTYECRALRLFWTTRVHPEYGRQLRLARDNEGQDLLPTPSETALALQEQLIAERAARSQAEHDKRIAEKKQLDAELKQRDAERKQRDAELKLSEEAHARLLAEQKLQEEAHARLLAEQKQRDAETKLAALLAELEQRNHSQG